MSDTTAVTSPEGLLFAPLASAPADGSGYRRVLLKLSGEAFGGGSVGVDTDLAAAEGLTRELEQHPLVAAAVGRLEGSGGGQRRCGVGQRVIPCSTSMV